MRTLTTRSCCFGLIGLCLGLGGANVPAAAARAERINLGTLAPRGSLYHKSLLAMGQKWRQAPGGGVNLVIFPDGTQGGEADMVRLMRVGTLQAGLLTAVGLADIEPGVSGLQNLPMAFHSLEEVDYVNAKLQPMLEKRMLEKGFVVLFWSDAGWVRYFSKQPLKTPEDLRQMKLFVWAGSPKQVDFMRRGGYQPVPLETADILTGLQTGLIDALAAPPIYALASQLDSRAPYMLELNWAPLVGALVLKREAWERIPSEAHPVLIEAARAAGREVKANSRSENVEAVQAMKRRGLEVQPVSAELEEVWRTAAEGFYPDIRDTIVPEDVFDEALRLIKEYRAQQATPSP